MGKSKISVEYLQGDSGKAAGLKQWVKGSWAWRWSWTEPEDLSISEERRSGLTFKYKWLKGVCRVTTRAQPCGWKWMKYTSLMHACMHTRTHTQHVNYLSKGSYYWCYPHLTLIHWGSFRLLHSEGSKAFLVCYSIISTTCLFFQ